ncbi:hypothetical protein [Sutcliffiella rhizosphaerae]|uniref:hypothetical protein n=1 Tax=Sutcliffiella rhizosphaerae TaxID=2880967 RepID=UPI001E3A73DC|nr:hypothetical protein [Sutcliffiella rhizosphaerae]
MLATDRQNHSGMRAVTVLDLGRNEDIDESDGDINENRGDINGNGGEIDENGEDIDE